MRRRDWLRSSALLGTLARPVAADVPTHLWSGYQFPAPPARADRLNQGPFGIEQDQGWYTIGFTTPLEAPLANFGCGMVGYTWEEGGPSIKARKGEETLEAHVEKMAALPFVDVLYIRCDWRDVQKRPGRLDLHPVWKLTLDAARRHGKRVAFRVMLSNTVGQPGYLAMPDFVSARVPIVPIGKLGGEYGNESFREPRYDHPAFQQAFHELTGLLAAEFDTNPLIEFIDLMQYGFWGEGHTSSLASPFPDYATAERTMLAMTHRQLEAFRTAHLAVNTQPDISSVGNREVIDLCVRQGCWLRSDSIFLDEPEQIEALSNRPPWLAVVMEDGSQRQYDTRAPGYLPKDEAGVNVLEKSMLHSLDLGANYWALWTETDNLEQYNRQYPRGFARLRQRMGYRVRPSWIWQRKRYSTSELIIAFVNDGVAGVPGALRIVLETADGRQIASGTLDAGHPYGGKTRQASFLLPERMEGATLGCKAFLETRGNHSRPLRWSCEQPLDTQGALPVRIKPHADSDWRKGV